MLFGFITARLEIHYYYYYLINHYYYYRYVVS